MSHPYRSDLPAEIWTMVFQLLDTQEQKQIRFTSTTFRNIATPFCFELLYFDISHDSIQRLAHIRSKEYLASCVRGAKLTRRRIRYRKFADNGEFQRSIILSGHPDAVSPSFNDLDDELAITKHAMSHDDPSKLGDAAKRRFFDEYNLDREAANDDMQSIIGSSLFRRTASASVLHADPAHQERRVSMMEKLAQAFAGFPHLSEFEHIPVADNPDRWATHWRHLRINPYDADSNSYREDRQEDLDIEALQVSCVLNVIGAVREFLPSFTSIKFCTYGPAFWGPLRLKRLWEGVGHRELQSARARLRRVDLAEEDVERLSLYSERYKYTRALSLMEDALAGLTFLDCVVSEMESDGGLLLAARSLFEFFCCGTQLQEVSLRFGWYSDKERMVTGTCDGTRELLTLLAIDKPWCSLTTLTLTVSIDEMTLRQFLRSVGQTLRDLSLVGVMFPHLKGEWQSALPAMVDSLPNLTNLHLAHLSETRSDGEHHLIFDELSPSGTLYDPEYEASIVEYLESTVSRGVVSVSYFIGGAYYYNYCKM